MRSSWHCLHCFEGVLLGKQLLSVWKPVGEEAAKTPKGILSYKCKVFMMGTYFKGIQIILVLELAWQVEVRVRWSLLHSCPFIVCSARGNTWKIYSGKENKSRSLSSVSTKLLACSLSLDSDLLATQHHSLWLWKVVGGNFLGFLRQLYCPICPPISPISDGVTLSAGTVIINHKAEIYRLLGSFWKWGDKWCLLGSNLAWNGIMVINQSPWSPSPLITMATQ